MAWLSMVETSCVRVFITLSKHWANNTISSISWILFSTMWWVVCYPTSMIESCIARTSLHAMRRDTSWYTLMQRQHKGRSENGCCDSELVSVGFFFFKFFRRLVCRSSTHAATLRWCGSSTQCTHACAYGCLQPFCPHLWRARAAFKLISEKRCVYCLFCSLLLL